MSFVSKDRDLVQLFKKSLHLKQKISYKSSGLSKEKKYPHIQFGDILFYRFLLKIGLMPRKSKKLKALKIPKKYFFDFLRGHFDGDGCIYSYFDPRWKKSFMFYTVFCSASKDHILWLREKIYHMLPIRGHINRAGLHSDGKGLIYQLKFAKRESLKLIPYLYQNENFPYFQRKFIKVQKILAQVEELADSPP